MFPGRETIAFAFTLRVATPLGPTLKSKFNLRSSFISLLAAGLLMFVVLRLGDPVVKAIVVVVVVVVGALGFPGTATGRVKCCWRVLVCTGGRSCCC